MASIEARALECFAEIADMSAQQQAHYLQRLQISDSDLQHALCRLLAADAQPRGLLQSPQSILARRGLNAPADAAFDPRIGSQLGAWRIVGLIGSGGMGRVYRASRADGQYNQEVALKCIDRDARQPILNSVLRNERSMLAMLEHPNIATLLDGGIDEFGSPWFAMQWVQGERIDVWCDQRRLSLRDRVELFIRLCDGLIYAHAKDALHGDIKPINVIVDIDGRPVLLDFGLSSLANRGYANTSSCVATTPAYAAPEIANTGHSKASDIYAMGVMLRDLLCGASIPNADLQFLSHAPQPLASTLALKGTTETATRRRMSEVAALSRALTGDLDRIISACTAADPARRLASIELLRQELKAWLTFRPLSLRRRQPLYRMRLFLRRHRALVLVGGLLTLGVCAGVAAGMHFHEKAEQKSGEAASIRSLFEHSFIALATGRFGQTPLMPTEQLRNVEITLRSRDAEGVIDTGMVGLMLLALAKSHAVLGDYPHAMGLVDEARLRLVERREYQSAIDATSAHLYNLQSQHQSALQAAKMGTDMLEDAPELEREQLWLALQVEQARAEWGLARIDNARDTLHRAMQRAAAMADQDPQPLAALLIQQAIWQQLFLQLEPAMASLVRAASLTEHTAPIVANEARFEQVRTFNQSGQHQQAVDLAKKLLADQRRILGDVHPETGKVLVELGSSQLWNGEDDLAMVSLQQGRKILGDALGDGHPETVRADMIIAAIEAQHGGTAEAVVGSRRALATMELVYGPDHQRTLTAVGYLAATLAMQAMKTPKNPEIWAEAVSLFERRVRSGQKQGLPVFSERNVLIKARLRTGDVSAKTAIEMEDIISGMAEARGQNSEAVRRARFTLVQVQLALDRLDDAERALRAILDDLAKAGLDVNTRIDSFNAHQQLGDIALLRDDRPSARKHWLEAIRIGKLMEPEQVSLRRVQEKLARLDGIQPPASDQRDP